MKTCAIDRELHGTLSLCNSCPKHCCEVLVSAVSGVRAGKDNRSG